MGVKIAHFNIYFTQKTAQINRTRKKTACPKRTGCFLAAGEGFEPSHTESESAVLPLHNPAIYTRECYYTHNLKNVKKKEKKKSNISFLSLALGV